MNQKLEIFLSYGFRPFFLLAPLWSLVVMIALLSWMGLHQAGGEVLEMTIAMAPYVWHAHEMIFGFAVGIIAGFFLTAVPSWTGTKAVHGGTLGALVAVWAAGRLAMLFSASLPAWLVAVLDLAFLPALAVLVVGALIQGWSKRNFVFLPILALLFVANLLSHLEFLGIYDDGVAMGHRLGIDAVILLISIIGGRVVPAFTTNALRQQGHEDLPVQRQPVNIAGIALVAALLIADLIEPESTVTGGIALAAALANALRLAGWRGLKTLNQPIVWVLHLGFAWLVAGLALKGLAQVTDVIVEATAIHALTAGAIGTMTLAIMSRAALGHTGRPLIVSRWTAFAYVAVGLAALTRVAVPPMFPALYGAGMLLSGGLWILAFATYLTVYWHVLTGPRGGRKAGQM